MLNMIKRHSLRSLPIASRSKRLRFEPLEDRRMLSTFDVLVFSRTAGFRHGSIDAGIAAIQALGADHDFSVDATENPNAFSDANLANYDAVIFLNTTGDVLQPTAQGAFERFIQAGGGYVGIHAAADTEYDWPWYGELMGGYFESHPAIQTADVLVADRAHPSTAHLPARWTRTDEWYNYQTNPRGNVHVLATLDESTYNGGTDGFDHPIAWCHDFDGGRSFYTGFGHTVSTFSEPEFLQHLLGGIEYAAGHTPADCGATIESNFETTVLDTLVLNPMELEVLPNGDVLFVERQGRVKIHKADTGMTEFAGQVQVTTQFEDGLLGVAVDPNYAENNWIYMFYSPPDGPPRQHVSRFDLVNDQLDFDSEEVLLEIPVQRTNCCHSGGSLAFGPDGSLYISTGDNTNPFESNGYAPIDERPGRSDWDAQKSSSNADDLRGKVLRIVPQDDGSYTIPDGNLFPSDGSAGRPEIFVMGARNPFRISVDQETGWLYWGDVGPDAGNPNPDRGPRGYDEINQARQAGNHGWPYFRGDNEAYRDYDFATGQSGDFFDPNNPVNDSPNNTGPQNLPPSQPAMIWYPYGSSAEFPAVGTGGRTAMAGPTYHFDYATAGVSKLPAYYDDTLFIYEWSRNWIKEVKLDDNGDVLAINDFMPGLDLARPIDMELGPDGAIYVLEWGTTFNGGNNDAQLIKIEYAQPTPSGDFDADGDLDCDDVNALTTAIANSDNDFAFDLTGDGHVDNSDLSFWLTEVYGTLPADGNLDRSVDASDFNIWNSNKFTNNSNFCDGDYNADGVVDASDFNAWNENKFQAASRIPFLGELVASESAAVPVAEEVNLSIDAAESPIEV